MHPIQLLNARKYVFLKFSLVVFLIVIFSIKMIEPQLLTNTNDDFWLEYGAPVTREGVAITTSLAVS